MGIRLYFITLSEPDMGHVYGQGKSGYERVRALRKGRLLGERQDHESKVYSREHWVGVISRATSGTTVM